MLLLARWIESPESVASSPAQQNATATVACSCMHIAPKPCCAETALSTDSCMSLQELGYMARRGHSTGVISTYAYSWGLWTDRKGLLRITAAIPHSQEGSETKVSVTEV